MVGVLCVVRIWEVTGLFVCPRVVFAPYVAVAPHGVPTPHVAVALHGVLTPHVVVGSFVVDGVVGHVPADAFDAIYHLRTAVV